GLTEITSLDAPHRVYDAILRDSLLDSQPFMKSPLGLRLAEAKPGDATALLEASPTALLFGAWHSTGEGGGLGAKFPRCLASEINHGNIAPSVQPLGVTCDHAEHVAVISFAALRRLSFGGNARDLAGRALLAALGLVAVTEQDARGYGLRSRCDLVCEGRAPI